MRYVKFKDLPEDQQGVQSILLILAVFFGTVAVLAWLK